MAKKRSQNQVKPGNLNAPELVKRRTSTKSKSGAPTTPGDFESLVVSIVQIHQQTQDFAARAVNLGLTYRNWLIGYRIVEFEQQGRDRAAYGENLMDKLSQSLATHGLPRVKPRELRRYRQFYQVYPQIWESVTPKSLAEAGLGKLLPDNTFQPEPIRESLTPESQNVDSISPQLIHRLSMAHPSLHPSRLCGSA